MVHRFLTCGAIEGKADNLKWLEPTADGHRTDGLFTHLDDSVVELALLLHSAQASALEAAA